MNMFSRLHYAALLAPVLALVLVAQPASASKTHLGQKAEDHVMLQWTYITGVSSCSFSNQGFVEVFPDGTAATQQYVVPAKHVLVITDVEWDMSEEALVPWLADTYNLIFGLRLLPGAHTVFEATEPLTSHYAAVKRWGGSRSSTAGFRVKPNVDLCPFLGLIQDGGSAAASLGSIQLRGYVVKSKD